MSVIRLAAATAFAVAGTATAGDFYRLEGFAGLAEGISNTGVAVGSFNVPQYFMWTVEDGPMLIGGLVPGSGIGGQAKISDDGLFVSGGLVNPATGLAEMARYDVAAGTWTPLGGLGASSGGESSSGWSISGDGQAVAGLAWIDAGTAHAAQWTAGSGTVADLGSTVAGESSRVNGTDFDGDVVVGWQDGAGRQGAVWVNGVQERIFLPDGSPSSEAFAVSSDGRFVTGIGFGSPLGAAQSYRYDTVNDTTEWIPNLAAGGQSRLGMAGITADGATIVGGTWGFGPATGGVAVIWREGVGTVRLSDYLDAEDIAYPAGYVFNFVSDVSPDGRWLVGWGNGSGGLFANETFVVDLGGGAPCPADLDGSGDVGFNDLLELLASYGTCAGCPADFDGNGEVDFGDLLALLAAWGPCA